MALPATDDFNRANGALGANWTTASGYSAPTVASNQCAGGFGSGAWWNADAFNASGDQYAQCTAQSAAGEMILIVRASGTRFYSLYWAIGGSGSLVIVRSDANGNTTFLNNMGNVGTANGDTMRLEASGSTFTAKDNGVTKGTASDSTYTGGVPGVGGGLDNFTGDNLGAAAAAGGIVYQPSSPIAALLSM
jgi:hypothetical protein